MVTLIASYLFDQPTHLIDIYNRKEDATTQNWTLSYLPGARPSKQPVFVLTSKRTFSGAEEFAFDLKNKKRATIVGETTGGGAHPVAGHLVADYFMVGVPFAKSLDPVTKTNWEETGVEPDVVVPSADALTTAEKLAIGKIQTKKTANSDGDRVPVRSRGRHTSPLTDFQGGAVSHDRHCWRNIVTTLIDRVSCVRTSLFAA